ncbi:Pml1 protein [Martiniozyma asiatica (nom. inval.)]|nr:Pml1 protein [Martiniozyma asiatica]
MDRLKVSLKPSGVLNYNINTIYSPPVDAIVPKETSFSLVMVYSDVKDKKQTIPLITAKSYILIGRSSNADITIKHPYDEFTSKEHCAFQFRDVDKQTKLYICDLKSTNGTWLNGMQIPHKRYIELRHGDRIRLGEWEFEDEDTGEMVYQGIEFIIVKI